MSSVLVLSSHTKPGSPAAINHAVYCERHGYDYLFDATPYRLLSPFDQKTMAAIGVLKRSRAEWVFWVDDDAFFMDHSKTLEAIIEGAGSADFIFCRSPVNLKGQWSYINAGLYFVRNTPRAIEVLEDVLSADGKAVRDWWDADRFGMYTTLNSDQEAFVYVLERRGMLNTSAVAILDHLAFNARPYHFTKRHDENFICHLASHTDKYVPWADMRSRFGLDRYLLPQGALQAADDFRYSVAAQDLKPKPAPTIIGRARRKALGMLSPAGLRTR
ncbi:putative nucleotide-diphospho-sugar transferase [Terrihabitans rhizophilus]|uniref:Nucleotide-diphospho-sugar transferase n=1 Tax=Terrihabitans rhizophilus TaxID=3092662 RepID=A0ABU4RSA7_9HYPH|nr:putative nucleotide-diphospho-sugar transferase [Terrihabitans sp. PJ23]MDX6806964.1 putative nucleotide-diphospho-sugar transferase [Terrihabitans sp. PJ23]